MKMPVEKTALSPNRSTNVPEISPEQKRVIAKAETIKPIAALLTPNDLAKTGIAGITMPKPTATKKDAATRIDTSRGRSLNGDRIKLKIPLQLLHEQQHNPLMFSVVLHEA
jgi:hypothetical protein